MSAALRPSEPPPGVALRAKALALGAKPLRGKDVPRSLSPLRKNAREHGAKQLHLACATHELSSASLAESLGLKGDRAGDEARSGALVVSVGETVLLPPLPVAIDVVVGLLEERVARERVASDSAVLRLVGVHLDALRALLTAPEIANR